MFNDLISENKKKKNKRVQWVKVLDYKKIKDKVQELQFEKIQFIDKLSNIANVVNDNKGKINKKEDMETLMDLILDIVNEEMK